MYHFLLAVRQFDLNKCGVLIYDLCDLQIPANWTTLMVPVAQMHQRLHENGSYDKWLVKVFIVVPNEIVSTCLTALLSSTYQPTRPFEIVTSILDIRKYVDRLWLPRNTS